MARKPELHLIQIVKKLRGKGKQYKEIREYLEREFPGRKFYEPNLHRWAHYQPKELSTETPIGVA